MSKEILKNLIELVNDEDIDTLYKIIIKFIDDDKPLPDEIDALEKANESIELNGMISHKDIKWD